MKICLIIFFVSFFANVSKAEIRANDVGVAADFPSGANLSSGLTVSAGGAAITGDSTITGNAVISSGSAAINRSVVAGRQLVIQTDAAGDDDFMSFYNNAGTETMIFGHSASNNPEIEFRDNTGVVAGSIRYQANLMDFHDAGGVLTLRVQNGGALVANLNQVNNTGDVCAQLAGAGTRILTACSSSLRYKEKVRDISSKELENFYKLRGVNFDWKKENGGHNDYGLIAEEVDAVFPQLAPKNEKGEVESVNYKHMVGLLIEVVKDHKKQLDELKKQLEK